MCFAMAGSDTIRKDCMIIKSVCGNQPNSYSSHMSHRCKLHQHVSGNKHKRTKPTFGPKVSLKIPPYVRNSSYKGMKKASLRTALTVPFASGTMGFSPRPSAHANRKSRTSSGKPSFNKLFFNTDGKLVQSRKKSNDQNYKLSLE